MIAHAVGIESGKPPATPAKGRRSLRWYRSERQSADVRKKKARLSRAFPFTKRLRRAFRYFALQQRITL
jgi:hypothetical protein